MRYINTMFAAAAVIALLMTTEGFTLEWSDGGPEMYPLQYPPATTTVAATPNGSRTVVAGWSDGGPEMYPLQYPPATMNVAATPNGNRIVIAGWSDGGPEMYPMEYPPETAAMKSAFRLSSLIGMDVRNAANQDLGSVNQVLVSENGRIKYLLLDQGGILGRDILGRGIGTKLYAVPWSAFAMQPADKMLTLNMSRDKLEMAPSFEKGEFAMLNDPAFEGRVYGYYGVKESAKSPAMMLSGKQGTFLAGSFINANVNDVQGVKLGKVRDFVAGNDGIIEYVVVRHGGSFLGIGSRLTPVPWKTARLETTDHTITLDVTNNRFLEAPTVKGLDWTGFDNTAWNKEIHDYYNK